MPDPIGTILAKTGLKAAGEAAKEFASKLVGPAAEELGLTLQDRIRIFRVRQQVKLLARTQEMLSEAGLEPRSVPLKVLAPLLDGATLEEEEDEEMRDRWAALLANAAAHEPGVVPPSFPYILRQLEGFDARVLQKLHESGSAAPAPRREFGDRFRPTGLWWDGAVRLCVPKGVAAPHSALQGSLSNLERLGLVDVERGSRYEVDERRRGGGGTGVEIRRKLGGGTTVIRLTEVGQQFVLACQPPVSQP